MIQKQQILRISYKIDFSHIFHRSLLDLKLMNSNHKSISTNTTMLITESWYSDNLTIINKKNLAMTDEDDSETTDFKNLSQDRFLTHFSQIISKFRINKY